MCVWEWRDEVWGEEEWRWDGCGGGQRRVAEAGQGQQHRQRLQRRQRPLPGNILRQKHSRETDSAQVHGGNALTHGQLVYMYIYVCVFVFVLCVRGEEEEE
jgi:hypothetical protein